MRTLKNIVMLIIMQHILHFRWIVSRYNPYINLSPKMIINTIITITVSVSIGFYFLFSAIFYLFKVNSIVFTVSMIESVFCAFYLLIFFYLIGNSFKEVYLRSFFSRDYHLLRLRNLTPFSIQVAKLVDAFFIEVVIFVIPLYGGLYFSILKAFNLKISVVWFLGVVNIIILALGVRMITMVLMYIWGEKSVSSFSKSFKIFSFIPQLFCAGFIFYILVRYFIDRDLFNVLIDTLMKMEHSNYLIYYLHGVILVVMLILFIVTLGILYLNKEKYDFYWFSNNGSINKKANKIISNLFMSKKVNSKIINLILKDILLLVRGENVSIGFIKSGLLTAFSFLGVMIALSNYLPGEHYQGINILVILMHQMVLIALLTVGLGKVTSLDVEKNWISINYNRLRNPYFIYIAKSLLHFSIVFPIVLSSTTLLLISINGSYLLLICLFISAFCLSITATLSFVLGSACFPNFSWESKDQINASFLSHVTENIFVRSYELVNISFIGIQVALLFGGRIVLEDFLISFLNSLIFTTVIWCSIIILILKAPLWKGWKPKC